MSQIRELQNDVNSLTDERDFHVPEGSSSSELWSILRSQQTLDYSESQRESPAAILQCRMIHGTLLGYFGKRF